MSFNTLHFALFFVIVYALYLVFTHKWQNRLLLVASYVFYAAWDWRFLFLILLSTLLNYFIGLKIGITAEEPIRKRYLILSVCLNLAILGFFKYFNFFADNLQLLLWAFGWHVSKVTLHIILPLGISFYTFQAMSYPIDIYRRVIEPTRRLLDFSLFIVFFPQLVAGPIERARNLLPQIAKRRILTLEQFYGGSWLIFWGLFKKIVVADNLARMTTPAFDTSGFIAGSSALLATYAFAFQVYADFSGYSDMARGLAKTLGFDIMVNFRVPFFSSNLYDFWQRWHISLTTWIKEYLYYPLALATFYGKKLKAPLVIILTWAIMGLWHGAAWKFIAWGIYHGVLLVIYSKIRPYLNLVKPTNRLLSSFWNIFQILIVFNLFCIGILFFAARSVPQVFLIMYNMIVGFFSIQYFNLNAAILLCLLVFPVVVIEYFQYRKNDELVVLSWPILARGCLYYLLIYIIIIYGDFSAQRYYYFQF